MIDSDGNMHLRVDVLIKIKNVFVGSNNINEES